MKKAKSKVQVAADFLKSTGPCLITLPSPEYSTEKDQIFMLNEGDMIWLAVENGPENPVLNIEDLLASEETAQKVLQIFAADADENLTNKKLYEFEDKLRAVLKTYVSLPEDKVREIKIAFMDAKEYLLSEGE